MMHHSLSLFRVWAEIPHSSSPMNSNLSALALAIPNQQKPCKMMPTYVVVEVLFVGGPSLPNSKAPPQVQYTQPVLLNRT